MDDIEQTVIEQLKKYKPNLARIKVLNKYPIGSGMFLSSLCKDDNLRLLHQQLRGLPTYMYLTKREQVLETTAHAYLTRYPTGTKAQLNAIPRHGYGDEDTKLLRELRAKIEKVIEARAGVHDNFDSIIDRISEIQDLEQENVIVDQTLEALAEYKSQYALLLRLRYVEDRPIDEVVIALNAAKRSFERWRPKAIEEYAKLIGLSGGN